MKDNKSKDCKKLTFDDRTNIQSGLVQKLSLSKIAQIIHKSKSTVSREIQRNSKTGIGYKPCHSSLVCNSCSKKAYCTKPKRYYDCAIAENKAHNSLVKSRRKSYISDEDKEKLNSILKDGIANTKSLHHTYMAHFTELEPICSERTCRRLIYRNELKDIKPFMLRRYVRINHNKKSEINPSPRRNAQIKLILGRTYTDYQLYRESHKDCNIVQLDSVIGTIHDENAILTITLVNYGFQFGLLIKKGDPSSVNNQFRKLFKTLGENLTNKVFAICLADNGTEFDLLPNLENLGSIKFYYTRTYKSSDKPECERFHEYLRYIYPKGKSLDDLTQKDLDDSYSNINNFIRESKDNKTPYQMVLEAFGKDFLDKINIKFINVKNIKLLAKI